MKNIIFLQYYSSATCGYAGDLMGTNSEGDTLEIQLISLH